ncbi:hypothetical protein K438DRAFT_1582223, partial [Mycena galopus ATCC 62051]
YLDRTTVTSYIALEPNELMHPAIRARAKAAGFRDEDVLILWGCGAEDPTTIPSQLDGAGLQVNTMLSILTIRSIPDPPETLSLRRSLCFTAAMEDEGPDGQPINMWSKREVWGKEDEPEEHLFWHRVGEFVKHSD